jgi:hypothetical protein
MIFARSMIINDLDVVGVSGSPDETQPPLVIYPDAVLACPIAFEFFKPIRWRNSQRFKLICCGKHF